MLGYIWNSFVPRSVQHIGKLRRELSFSSGASLAKRTTLVPSKQLPDQSGEARAPTDLGIEPQHRFVSKLSANSPPAMF